MQISAKTLFSNPEFFNQGWEVFYPRHAPLNLEIGCGYGHFIEYLAQNFPQQNFLGLDIVSKVLQKAEKRLQKAQLTNARLIKLDANLALHELFPDQSLENIFILFPDPWPKERHQNRRIMRQEMLSLFVNKLQPGGALHFVSDDLPYVAQAQALLDTVPEFEAIPFPALEIKTKYEKKWEAMDKTITRLCYRRTGQADKHRPWPHIATNNHVLTAWSGEKGQKFLAEFAPFVLHQAPYYLKFTAAYGSLDQQRLLLEVILAEPEHMAQPFFVQIDATGQLSLPPTSYLPRLLRRDAVMQALLLGIQQKSPSESRSGIMPI